MESESSSSSSMRRVLPDGRQPVPKRNETEHDRNRQTLDVRRIDESELLIGEALAGDVVPPASCRKAP